MVSGGVGLRMSLSVGFLKNSSVSGIDQERVVVVLRLGSKQFNLSSSLFVLKRGHSVIRCRTVSGLELQKLHRVLARGLIFVLKVFRLL